MEMKNYEFVTLNGIEYVKKSKVDEMVNKAIIDILAENKEVELPIGEIVCLNSGSPEMTVCSPIREILDNKVVRCAWFDNHCNIHLADIAIDALSIVEYEDNEDDDDPTPPTN